MVNLKAFLVVLLLLGLTGCGQTVRGVRDDASRIGRGVRQIFVSD